MISICIDALVLFVERRSERAKEKAVRVVVIKGDTRCVGQARERVVLFQNMIPWLVNSLTREISLTSLV